MQTEQQSLKSFFNERWTEQVIQYNYIKYNVIATKEHELPLFTHVCVAFRDHTECGSFTFQRWMSQNLSKKLQTLTTPRHQTIQKWTWTNSFLLNYFILNFSIVVFLFFPHNFFYLVKVLVQKCVLFHLYFTLPSAAAIQNNCWNIVFQWGWTTCHTN